MSQRTTQGHVNSTYIKQLYRANVQHEALWIQCISNSYTGLTYNTRPCGLNVYQTAIQSQRTTQALLTKAQHTALTMSCRIYTAI